MEATKERTPSLEAKAAAVVRVGKAPRRAPVDPVRANGDSADAGEKDLDS
jgi:hypothetical protein